MDYIPTKDSDALSWLRNFAAKLTISPATYLVSPADALAVTAAVNLFDTALTLLEDPLQRNKINVIAKDDARTAAEQMCRQYAMQIKTSAAISDADKVEIGVRPPTTVREPIPPPTSSPVLNIFGAGYATHTVTFKDSATPAESRQKPYGVKQLQLYYSIAEGPVTDPEAAKFHGLHTRSPIGIAFDPDDAGKKVTYFARWCTIKGEVGPWSAPVNMAIAA
jgi:hypothetical protein